MKIYTHSLPVVDMLKDLHYELLYTVVGTDAAVPSHPHSSSSSSCLFKLDEDDCALLCRLCVCYHATCSCTTC